MVGEIKSKADYKASHHKGAVWGTGAAGGMQREHHAITKIEEVKYVASDLESALLHGAVRRAWRDGMPASRLVDRLKRWGERGMLFKPWFRFGCDHTLAPPAPIPLIRHPLGPLRPPSQRPSSRPHPPPLDSTQPQPCEDPGRPVPWGPTDAGWYATALHPGRKGGAVCHAIALQRLFRACVLCPW